MLEHYTLRLMQIRKAAGKTQEQVAGVLGVSKATYSTWETGRSRLSADRLIEICNVFNCTPNDILDYPSSDGRFSTLSDEEERLVELYRLCPPNVRMDISDLLRTCAKGWRGV